jgi:glycosyltransferase involved in cell wall biosynthesis
MTLTVLSVAFPLAPVGHSAVGGAEQVLSDLDEALVAAGQRSVVVACEGSAAAGELFAAPRPQREVLEEADRRWCRKQFQPAIDRALAAHRVDVIHMHGMDFDQYVLPADVPVVVTLHMPIGWYAKDIWRRFAGRVQFVCVSETQRRSCPMVLRDEVVVVENGVRLPEFREAGREDFGLVLGRICAEKNAHEALEAGTRAGMRVLLGGQVFRYEEHQRYFAERVRPLLLRRDPSGARHEFLGALSAERREHLLARARCLLHPTLAPETSSLVAMEAMAAGTPVIAYRSGALPEIVEDGVTGFLVDGGEEMAGAIRRVSEISPQACRAAAERRFSRDRMVEGYFELYQTLAQRRETERAYA